MVEPYDISRTIAAATLVAMAVTGIVILGAVVRRFAGRPPGTSWGTAVAFGFGLQGGAFLLLSEGDPLFRAATLAIAGAVGLWLLWRGRRVQAGGFIAGMGLPWTLLWGFYALLLATGAEDVEPASTWVLFGAGALVTIAGLALVVAGNPLPPEPDRAAPAGQPGSRRVGIVAQVVLAPERIGPMSVSEIAAFLTTLAVVVLTGMAGLPVVVEAAVAVGVGALAGNAARMLARPTRSRRAFEAFSWLGEWELRRAQALTGRGTPTTRGEAEAWLAEVPERPETRWIRVEILAFLDRLAEGREVAARMPDGTPYERFERAFSIDLVDWMAGGDGDPAAVRAVADEIPPGDDRLRATVAMAIRDAARIIAERGPEPALEPLLAARDAIGAHGDRQLWRGPFRRFLPISVATAVVNWLLFGWLG